MRLLFLCFNSKALLFWKITSASVTGGLSKAAAQNVYKRKQKLCCEWVKNWEILLLSSFPFYCVCLCGGAILWNGSYYLFVEKVHKVGDAQLLNMHQPVCTNVFWNSIKVKVPLIVTYQGIWNMPGFESTTSRSQGRHPTISPLS